MIDRFREPVTIPRWVLTVKYLMFALVGAAVLNTSSPSLERVYDFPLTVVWSILLIASSLLALVGSMKDEWSRAEKWGVTSIFVLMWIYAVAPVALVIQGDSDRLAYSAIAVLVSLLPYARSLQLWNKSHA